MAHVPIQSLIDYIKTACDVDPWAKIMAQELLKRHEPAETEIEVLNEIDRLYRCSNCHRYLFYIKQKYCDKCGQTLKWE